MTQSGSEDQLTLFAEDILASPLALPGSEEAIKMTDISGRRCLGLSKLSGPAGCVEKMLLVTSLWASTRCYLTWKPQATPAGALLFRLSPQMPSTDEIDAGFWATPRTTDGTGGPRKLDEKGRRISQTNPDLVFGANLADQAKMWPTPQASDNRDRGCMEDPCVKRRVKIGKQIGLSTAVKQTRSSGSLNPQFVEYLMGYPVGYTDLDS